MDYFEYIRRASRGQLCALLCNMWTDPDRLRDSTFITEPYRRKVMDFLNSEAPVDAPISTAEEMFKDLGYKLTSKEIHRSLPDGHLMGYSFMFRNRKGGIVTVSSKSVLKSGAGTHCITNDELAAINALREEMKGRA